MLRRWDQLTGSRTCSAEAPCPAAKAPVTPSPKITATVTAVLLLDNSLCPKKTN